MRRPRGLRLPVWLALLAAGALLGAAPAQAVCPDESGIGGTGLSGDQDSGVGGTGLSGDEESGIGGTGLRGEDDESGVGGTGLRSAGRSREEESGIGGTGLRGDDESGLGGTGLLGTITAYGSICVNGFTVEYDQTTPVEDNGVESSVSALSLGSVVLVDAEPRDGALRARRVAVRHAAMGPATDIDPDGRTLEVIGQRVTVPRGAWLADRQGDEAAASLDDFEPGDYLAVSGLRESDGRIVATRVERRPARDEVSAIGRLEGLEGLDEPGGGRARLDQAEIRVAAAGMEADRELAVLVRGHWNERERRIEDARIERAYRLGEQSERVSVEGFVQDIDDEGRGTVAGLPVVIARDVRGDRSPARGDRVRLSGRLDRDGRIRAREVRVDRDWRERLDREHRDRGDRGAGRDRDRDDDKRGSRADRDRDDDRERGERSRDERAREDRERERDDRDRDRDDRDRDEREGRGKDERDRDDDRDDRGKPDDDD